MKSILKLKNWLTLGEAARHLSSLLGEDITEADILRLALDGRLTLSVYFVNTVIALRGKIIPYSKAEFDELPDPFGGEPARILKNGVQLDVETVLSFAADSEIPRIEMLEGVWDLTMLGAEQLDVERKYQELTGGPAVRTHSQVGAIVSRPDGAWAGIIAEADLEKGFLPSGSLPSDSVFVVKTSAFLEFEARLSEPQPVADRAMGRRERATLLTIIAALAKIAKIDVSKPSKAAAIIEGETSRMGSRVAARTIEDHLNCIQEAVESKLEN